MNRKEYVICAGTIKGYNHDSAIFFRPDANGYTCDLLKAGLYTEEEAKKECEHPDGLTYFHIDELKPFIETHAVRISGLLYKKYKEQKGGK